jgi:hypothetical protein
MKRFLIEYKEITYGVVEVFAESEEEARNIAECEGNRIVNDSEMELWQVQKEEDLSTKYKSM